MDQKEPKSSFKQNFKSAIAALFGIQSNQQREQDFQSRSPWRFVLAGLIAIGLLLGSLLLVVQWVLS